MKTSHAAATQTKSAPACRTRLFLITDILGYICVYIYVNINSNAICTDVAQNKNS
jgi:hypothetical protein